MSAEHERTIEATDAAHRRHLALLEAAIADPRAFEPLYGRYAEDVYYFCYRRLGQPEDAADATSQVFVKVLRALPGYAPDPTNAGASFRAWLFRIAQRTVIDIQRRHTSTDTIDTLTGDEEPVQIVDPGPSPEERLIVNEDARRVRSMLAKLPERQRTIVELRLADLSGQEIAAAIVAVLLLGTVGGAWWLGPGGDGPNEDSRIRLAAVTQGDSTPAAIWPEPLTPETAPWVAAITPAECDIEPMPYEDYAKAVTTDPGGIPDRSYEIVGPAAPDDAQAAVQVLRG